MRSPQPPITNQEEYQGYRAAAERLRQMMVPHEQELWQATHHQSPDQSRIDQIRGHLRHLYQMFQDIQEQINTCQGPHA